MINTTTRSNAAKSSCTCPSGDASLRWPCPTHPNANYTSLRHYGSPSLGQGAPVSAPKGALTKHVETTDSQARDLVLVLRKAATAATPGPWKAIEWTCHAPTTVRAGAVGITVAETTGHGRHSEACAVDAAYIAAVNPLAVLSLLDYIATLEAQLADRAAAANVGGQARQCSKCMGFGWQPGVYARQPCGHCHPAKPDTPAAAADAGLKSGDAATTTP